MKGKTKAQKGITLIALIITIVVLLILAAVAISNIQNDGILKYAQNASSDYNKAIRDEQSILDEYLSYIKGDNGWVTIYEGTAETDENGELNLSDSKHLFTTGNKYRITVESEEYTGTVETTAVYVGSTGSFSVYVLFLVVNSQPITASSIAEYEEKLGTITEGSVILFQAVNSTGETEKSSSIAVGNLTENVGISGCKITKIEEKAKDPNAPLWEGELTVASMGQVTLPFETSLTRKYELNYTLNGTSMTGVIQAIEFMGQAALGLVFESTNTGLFMTQGICLYTGSDELVLKSIKDVGATETYVEENGFAAIWISETKRFRNLSNSRH